jgi:hypothetical protein
MTTWTDRTDASDDEFQREVIERFHVPEVAPESWQPETDGLRDEVVAVAREFILGEVGFDAGSGMTDQAERFADVALAVFAAHRGQQQEAIERVLALADAFDERSQAADARVAAYHHNDYDAGMSGAYEHAADDLRDGIRAALGTTR